MPVHLLTDDHLDELEDCMNKSRTCPFPFDDLSDITDDYKVFVHVAKSGKIQGFASFHILHDEYLNSIIIYLDKICSFVDVRGVGRELVVSIIEFGISKFKHFTIFLKSLDNDSNKFYKHLNFTQYNPDPKTTKEQEQNNYLMYLNDITEQYKEFQDLFYMDV